MFLELQANASQVKRFDARSGLYRRGWEGCLFAGEREVWRCGHVHKSGLLAVDCTNRARHCDDGSLAAEEIAAGLAA